MLIFLKVWVHFSTMCFPPSIGRGQSTSVGLSTIHVFSFYLVAESGLGGEEVIKGAHCRNGHKNCTCPYSNKNGCVTCFNIHFLNI